MNPFQNENLIILGARRGLGLALAQCLISKFELSALFLCSRKINELSNSPLLLSSNAKIKLLNMDFSKNENIQSLHKEIIDFNPHRLIYCAGGGPYGSFHKKTWQSHAWSFHLNFLFPGELLHTLLSDESENISNLKQLVFIGSTIAEDQPDPFAASYAAGKHALKGLISSLVEESKKHHLKDFTPWDIRLYSPGYMDTSLLPAQSLPRKQIEKILLKPENVAEDILTWMSQPLNDTHWHRKVPNESLLNC